MAQIREVALNEPLLAHRLISTTGHVTGVNVTVQLPGKSPTTEVPEVVHYARDLLAKYEAKYPDIDLRLNGRDDASYARRASAP